MKRQGSYRITIVWLAGMVGILVGGAAAARAEIIMSEPTNLGPVINDAADVQESDFSHDGLELYFSSGRPGGYGRKDIWVAKRETIYSPWQEPVNLGPAVNSSAAEVEPAISPDGLELYFRWWDDWNLRVCTRPFKNDPWSNPVKVGPPVGSLEDNPPVGSNDAYGPAISGDGLSLYFASTRVGGYGQDDIWVARRATTADPWTQAVNLGPNVNSPDIDWAPSISADGLTLVFSRGLQSIWATTRKSTRDDWGPAVQLEIGGPGYFFSPALSPDGSALYFQAVNAWGGYGKNDFWQVTFTLVADFNLDGLVDVEDVVIMTEHWGKKDPLCDIAPWPVGDAMVDVLDLAALVDRIDSMLVAHWALDETEGIFAHDSAGEHTGTVVGVPLWHPDAGQVDGALEFNGTTFVLADHVRSPAAGPFCVLAWVKGGAPGQAIISQQGGVNWLMADPATGALMTELSKGSGLSSQAIITDGNWHRIQFLWDGTNRRLYVDEVLVAEDTQDGLAGSSGKMLIGCGKNMAPASVWKGLIDDVRIYDQAVKP